MNQFEEKEEVAREDNQTDQEDTQESKENIEDRELDEIVKEVGEINEIAKETAQLESEISELATEPEDTIALNEKQKEIAEKLSTLLSGFNARMYRSIFAGAIAGSGIGLASGDARLAFITMAVIPSVYATIDYIKTRKKHSALTDELKNS